MKKLLFILLILSFGISIAGCEKENKKETPGTESVTSAGDDNCQVVKYGVAGNIKEIKESENDDKLGFIYVEGSSDNGAEYDKANVAITKDTTIYADEKAAFEDLAVGQYVRIFFEGPVMESYPVQATAKQVNIVPENTGENNEE